MIDLANAQVNGRWQVAAYAAMALVALGFTVVLIPSSSAHFRRFFGSANPALVVIGASVLGAAALGVLHSHGGFEILKGRATLQGMALSAKLATLLAVAIIIADWFIRYPEDTNVPPPEALLFYPAVGFVAEIVFHILPLALLMLALTPLAQRFGAERMVWLGILLVAALEPTFQVTFGGKPLTWGDAYTWIHVFAIAFLQLTVFRRYDLVSMVSLRMFYYAYWHIIWGVIRLKLLF